MPTIAELKARLKSMNIKGVAGKNKTELMAMLEGSPVPARDRTPVAMSPRGASHLATAMNRLLGRGTGGAPPLSDALAKLREVEAATKGRNEARAAAKAAAPVAAAGGAGGPPPKARKPMSDEAKSAAAAKRKATLARKGAEKETKSAEDDERLMSRAKSAAADKARKDDKEKLEREGWPRRDAVGALSTFFLKALHTSNWLSLWSKKEITVRKDSGSINVSVPSAVWNDSLSSDDKYAYLKQLYGTSEKIDGVGTFKEVEIKIHPSGLTIHASPKTIPSSEKEWSDFFGEFFRVGSVLERRSINLTIEHRDSAEAAKERAAEKSKYEADVAAAFKELKKSKK